MLQLHPATEAAERSYNNNIRPNAIVAVACRKSLNNPNTAKALSSNFRN